MVKRTPLGGFREEVGLLEAQFPHDGVPFPTNAAPRRPVPRGSPQGRQRDDQLRELDLLRRLPRSVGKAGFPFHMQHGPLHWLPGRPVKRSLPVDLKPTARPGTRHGMQAGEQAVRTDAVLEGCFGGQAQDAW